MNKEMITELTNVKEKIKDWQIKKKDIEISFSEYCFPKDVKEYTIVTKEGIKYIVNAMCSQLPNIEDIVYVHKTMCIRNKGDFCYYDTINGFYNDWGLFINTLKSFTITKQVGNWLD